MTEDDCVLMGGHCFTRTGVVRPTDPPQYKEICKHCPVVRWAVPRDAFEYHYEVTP